MHFWARQFSMISRDLDAGDSGQGGFSGKLPSSGELLFTLGVRAESRSVILLRVGRT
jgi:hypothetical protein